MVLNSVFMGKELLEYAINDSQEKGKSGICTLYEVNELTEYAKDNNIKINFIKIDSLPKAKNAPCIFNNWANYYKGEFVSNTILNANPFKKLID